MILSGCTQAENRLYCARPPNCRVKPICPVRPSASGRARRRGHLNLAIKEVFARSVERETAAELVRGVNVHAVVTVQ